MKERETEKKEEENGSSQSQIAEEESMEEIVQEIDLNSLFPDAEEDLNRLFPDMETRQLLKKVNKNKKDLHSLKDRLANENQLME